MKYVMYAIVGVVVLFIGVPLIGGIISGVKPSKSIEMAQQKQAENREVYVPEGFTLTKKAEATESEFGTLYVTEMTSSDNSIQIIESTSAAPDCKGVITDMDGVSTCYFATGTVPGNPKAQLVMWSANDKSYQLQTVSTLMEAELKKIVASL